MTAVCKKSFAWPVNYFVFHLRIWVLALVFPMSVVSGQTKPNLPDFADLVDQVGPAVVNIRTVGKSAARSNRGAGPEQDMQELLRRFFGDRMPLVPRPSPPSQQEQEASRGVGSGFIINSDGWVMTNAHVVDGADEIVVMLTDRREFKAKLIGADKRSDVAILKVEAVNLPSIKVGDNNKLRVGDWVLAIGSPFGLDNTVTAGIVSAKQRDTGEFLPLIQTDVAINPGNSGGPLINLRGEVVGINSQIYSKSGGFMGISFSIPIDEAMRVGEQLRTIGRVVRGRIGIEIERVTKEQAEAVGLQKLHGALVKGVQSGSVSERAGIKAGDVIVKFDGKVVESASDLPRFVAGTKPGTRTTVTVFRKGVNKDLPITVIELESDNAMAAAGQTEPSKPSSSVARSFGLSLSDLSAVQRRDLKLKQSGVRVDQASQVAARAGLLAGDILLSLAGTEVGSVQEVEAILAKIDKSKPVYVQFLRGDWTRYAIIRP